MKVELEDIRGCQAHDSLAWDEPVSEPDDDPPTTEFERLVQSHETDFEAYDVDNFGQIAKGLFIGNGGRIYDACLSYDDQSHFVSICVELGRVSNISTRQFLTLMHIQSTARMARLDLDDEDRSLSAHAASVSQSPFGPSFVIATMFEELKQILDDDRLHAVLGR